MYTNHDDKKKKKQVPNKIHMQICLYLIKSCTYLRKITASKIHNIIFNMKGGSASGKDGISINDIKQIKETITDILGHIFNMILWEGTTAIFLTIITINR